MKENGCYSCGAETFNACGCEDKDAETFGSEMSELRTGAMYRAGAVIGITGATMVLGALMSLFSRRS